MSGLERLLKILTTDPVIAKITVVADGDAARSRVESLGLTGFELETVTLGAGIHVMWNIAKDKVEPGNHFWMINDDVSINEGTAQGLSETLNKYPELGLVCPNYDGRTISEAYFPVEMTCGGNYAGGGGLGGFCMMLNADLVPEWRFDERMKWWYGDDDIVAWVRRTKGRVVAICANATCADNVSWTLTNDPPVNFLAEIENDGRIFTEKWGQQ